MRGSRLRTAALAGLALGVMALGGGQRVALASDHDDGETETKTRNLNLTDLYVFREDGQSGNAADQANLIFILNCNPRSLARQQYFFNTQAHYEFNVTRAGTNNASAVKGVPDLGLRFEFGPPSSSGQQTITLTRILYSGGVDVNEETVAAGLTTASPPGIGSPTEVITPVPLDGSTLTVFAGLREDPFFFDVEQFFRVRAGALGLGPSVGFRTADQAVDFAKGYNVLSIVVRVPIAFLNQGGNSSTIFDVWETILVPQ